MRGRLLLLTWIVATAAATGVAWLGVRSIVNEVAAPLPVPAPAAAPSPTAVAGSEPESGSQPSSETATQPPEPATTTFAMTGGTATVRFAPGEVAVLSAVPSRGFETDVDNEDGRVRVEFRSDDHRSRLEVWWDGAPRHSIREQEQGGDDDDRRGED